jgi:hypothetical protein
LKPVLLSDECEAVSKLEQETRDALRERVLDLPSWAVTVRPTRARSADVTIAAPG